MAQRPTNLRDVERMPGELVLGAYIWPIRMFGPPYPLDPIGLVEVVREAEVGGMTILVTRIGGLFAKAPDHLVSAAPTPAGGVDPGIQRQKLAFVIDMAGRCNRLICELVLQGVLSEPISPIHVHRGNLVQGYAVVTSAAGQVHTSASRSMDVTRMIETAHSLLLHEDGIRYLDVALQQNLTGALAAISSSLPLLVASSYWLFAEYRLAETVVDAWVVVEQIVDAWWQQYLQTIKSATRLKLLRDQRIFGVAVRLELLHTAGFISGDVYDQLNAARTTRNDMAHRAQVHASGAESCMTAMRLAIEQVVAEPVAHAYLSPHLSW